ncbi:hypothetical protein BpHYR1_004918 [Brachionus plicatilis]|uniref:Uncharacterized protein n=1 Tax=Brachionus plicatilis TaxID=10195 RepID=A0A3M7QZL3_BRAPC|nr:hypothetical protein BpHYR1_004918 [Brachionus plicatilis]
MVHITMDYTQSISSIHLRIEKINESNETQLSFPQGVKLLDAKCLLPKIRKKLKCHFHFLFTLEAVAVSPALLEPIPVVIIDLGTILLAYFKN